MEQQDEQESEYLFKTSCEGCGSSDANAVYSNGSNYCFSCGKYTPAVESKPVSRNRPSSGNSELLEVEPRPLIKRGISEKTCNKFSYGYNNNRQVATYHDKDGRPVAQKIRTKDKEFSWVGKPKQATLFGQSIWAPHPKKRIVVTEGEVDALSISEAQGNKWAVVSVPNGAPNAAKDIRKSLEYLSGFKEVVICFDMDEAGQEGAREVASLLPPNKGLIARLPMNDANEMLKANKGAELIQCLWDAKSYRPDGIVAGEDVLVRMQEEKTDTSYPLPDWLPVTNEKTKGIRLGELDVFTSGTGMGKSSLIKELQHHILTTTNLNQGMLHLEESLEFTAKSLVGLSLSTRLHMNNFTPKEEIVDKARELFTKTDDDDCFRLNLYDAFGSVGEEDLYGKIRFMVKGMGCHVIWLDHLSILVSSLSQESDERRTIDRIMHNLKSLTQELGCYIGLISHLNNSTNGGPTFEEGAVPNLNNLRGSGSIKQLSDTVYAISRNQQAETEDERNTAKITILKCRFTGETGKSDEIFYNNDTGRFEKPPEKPKDGDEDTSDFE